MSFTTLSKLRIDEVEFQNEVCRGSYEVVIGSRGCNLPGGDEKFVDWNVRLGDPALPKKMIMHGVYDSETFDAMFAFRVCERMFTMRARLMNVIEVNLAGTRIGDMNFMHMLTLVSGTFPLVRVLNVSDCNLTDISLALLGRSMSLLRELQVLDVSGNKKVTDAGVMHFFLYFGRVVNTLHSLSLARTGVKEFFVDGRVCEILMRSDLERLDLRGCVSVEFTSVVGFLLNVIGRTKLTCFMPGLSVAIDAINFLENTPFFQTNKKLAVMHMPGWGTNFEYGLDEYMRLKSVNVGLKMNGIVPLNRIRGSLSSRFFRASIYRPLSGGRFQQMVLAVFLCNGGLGRDVKLGEEVVGFILSFLKMGDF